VSKLWQSRPYQTVPMLLGLILAPRIFSFPEMVRHKYPSCTSCHVSPTGGGNLTAYGKMSSSELLSTLPIDLYEKPREFVPSFIEVGGDTRYINANYETGCGVKTHRKFLMQSDMEISYTNGPLVLSGTTGIYNYTKGKVVPVQRRYYAMLSLLPDLSLRMGKFFPAYGIHHPDHTLASRQYLGFGQGKETMNVEASYRFKHGEIFLTGVNGDTGSLSASESLAWKKKSGEHGYTLRAAVYIFNSVLGVSAQRLVEKNVRTSTGLYLISTFGANLYALMQIDRLLESRQWVWTSKIGYEAFKGLHLSLTTDGVEREYKNYRATLNLFPIPHYELSVEYIRKLTTTKQEGFVIVFHHYM
jgi:hypothetical protein